MCFFLHYCALITVRVWLFCVTHYRGCRVQCLFISFSFEVHARRIQALKALTYAPSSNSEILSRLYEIVFGLLDKVCPAPTFTISLASSSVLHFFNCQAISFLNTFLCLYFWGWLGVSWNGALGHFRGYCYSFTALFFSTLGH